MVSIESAATFIWMVLIIIPSILAFAGCVWCIATITDHVREEKFWRNEKRIWETQFEMAKKQEKEDACDMLVICRDCVEESVAQGYEAVVYDGATWCIECLPDDVVHDEVVPITDRDGWICPPICFRCGHKHGYAIKRLAL